MVFFISMIRNEVFNYFIYRIRVKNMRHITLFVRRES